MKSILLTVALASSFGAGFAVHSVVNRTPTDAKRVTGIGGIFFKCQDPAKLKGWYKTHLGMDISAYGATFAWREDGDSTKKGSTLWTPFKQSTKYFDPSTKDFMINYRVTNLEGLVADLKRDGVTVVDSVATYDYGKFVHVMDIEGNKIELWEPR
jgi:predicted enzyme related to lactoylglutathione lyase